MKRLILMRHAKSDWSNGGKTDHDRPLNARGKRGAIALGNWLRERSLHPDQVLCSSAARTGETLTLLGLNEGTPITFTLDLYLATHNRILETLRGATGDVVLMLGHNPGISMMAAGILGAHPEHPKFDQYPSGATLVADFHIEGWSDANWGNAIAQHFIVPRDL